MAVGKGPYARQLATAFADLGRPGRPYLHVIEADAAEAARLLGARQRVLAIITIPADLDRRLAAGEPAHIRLHVSNINANAAGNVRYRVTAALDLFHRRAFPGTPGVVLAEEALLPREIHWSSYMATSMLAFAALLGSLLAVAYLTAREWDTGTILPLRPTPLPVPALVAGKALAGLVEGSAAGLCLLALVHWLFAVPLPGGTSLAALLAGMSLLALAGAGLGLALAARIRRALPLTPVAVVLTLGLWILGGGFVPTTVFGGGFRTFSLLLPTTHFIDLLNQAVWQAGSAWPAANLAALAAMAGLGVLAGGGALARALGQR